MKPAKPKKNTTHSFEIDDAIQYGTDAAVLLFNIRHWLSHNKANNSNIHDGYVWTYNSKKAFSELFPYMSEDTVKRNLKKLCDAGVLMTGNYNERRYDRTTWYTIPAEFSTPLNSSLCEIELSIVRNRLNHSAKSPNGLGENAEPIPNINTDITTNINFFSSLSENEKECYEWAKFEPYWGKLLTKFPDRFKHYYHNGKMREQFEKHQAKKNQSQGANLETGLNSSNTNSNGGYYEPRNQNNASNGGTGRKLSAVDRVKLAQQQQREQREQQRQAAERVIN